MGERAPSFALPAAPGEIIDLADHLGREKIVLLFFPLAFSSVCTRELCTVREDWRRWQDVGARVLAISVDSPFVTSRFRETERLPFPVLSDFNREAGAAYGVLYEDYFGLRGVAKRSAFVIATDGTVAYAWVSDDDGVEPDYDAVIRAVAETA